MRLGVLGEYVGFATTRTATTWKNGEPKVGRTLILALLRLGHRSRRQDTAIAPTALELLWRYMVVGGGDNYLQRMRVGAPKQENSRLCTMEWEGILVTNPSCRIKQQVEIRRFS